MGILMAKPEVTKTQNARYRLSVVHRIKSQLGIHTRAKKGIEFGRNPWSMGYGEDSRSRGREFESQPLILKGNFSL